MSVVRALAIFGAAAALAGCAHAPADTCSSSSADVAAIEATVHAFFDAAKREDAAALRRSTTAGFYSFDAGKRFDGPGLVDAIRQAHAGGVQLNWNIGAIDTHFGCGMAWSAWENRGSAGIPPNVAPARWLESAVLVREEGRWKIAFFHSARAANTER